jgi:Zn-dependent protease with chaperone function
MRTIKNIAMFLIIPALTYLVCQWYLYDFDSDLQADLGMTIYELCSMDDAEIQAACTSDLYEVNTLKASALYSSIAAFMLVIFYQVASKICSTNRSRIAAVFPKVVPLVLLGLAICVFVQGIMLTYIAYLAQILILNAFYPVLTGAVGLGAVFASFGILRAIYDSIGVKDHIIINGHYIEQTQEPRLVNLINSIASSLGARTPDNVVVGLDPTFYVVSNPIKIAMQNKHLTGETLYLSLPLMRTLSEAELRAIIGHELGHFVGDDTKYSRKFYPVYTSITQSVDTLIKSESVAALPASYTLSSMLASFDTAVKTIGRERELSADIFGAKASSGEALTLALLKLSIYNHAWAAISNQCIKRISNGGGYSKNISWLFQSVVQHNINSETVMKSVEIALNEPIAHPNDSHPTTLVRAKNLGVDVRLLTEEKFLVPLITCETLIEHHLEIEEELTTFQQIYYEALGIRKGEPDNTNILNKIIAMFAAHITVADGSVEKTEIDIAESVGASFFKEFDFFDFREYCHYPETMISIENLLGISDGFNAELKSIIHQMCCDIANANGDFAKEEAILIETIKTSFKIL